MKLSAPKQITWIVALVLAIVGIIAQLVTIPVLSGLAFWIVVVAVILLLVATYIDGL